MGVSSYSHNLRAHKGTIHTGDRSLRLLILCVPVIFLENAVNSTINIVFPRCLPTHCFPIIRQDYSTGSTINPLIPSLLSTSVFQRVGSSLIPYSKKRLLFFHSDSPHYQNFFWIHFTHVAHPKMQCAEVRHRRRGGINCTYASLIFYSNRFTVLLPILVCVLFPLNTLTLRA